MGSDQSVSHKILVSVRVSPSHTPNGLQPKGLTEHLVSYLVSYLVSDYLGPILESK
jgi:hypothetical protein